MPVKKFIFILLFMQLAYCQDNKNFNIGIVDGITKSDIYLNIKLNDKWYIQNSLRASYFENAYYQLEIPVTLQYKIRENWTVFTGPRFKYVNDFNFQNNNSQNYNFSFQLGSRYYFSRKFYAEFYYEYNFLDPSRNINSLINHGSFFKFGIGYQF